MSNYKPFIYDGVIILRTVDVKSIVLEHERQRDIDHSYFPRIRINVAGKEHIFSFSPTREEYKEWDNLSPEECQKAREELRIKKFEEFNKFYKNFCNWMWYPEEYDKFTTFNEEKEETDE